MGPGRVRQRQSLGCVAQCFDMNVARPFTRFPIRIVIESDDDRRSTLRSEARTSSPTRMSPPPTVTSILTLRSEMSQTSDLTLYVLFVRGTACDDG